MNLSDIKVMNAAGTLQPEALWEVKDAYDAVVTKTVTLEPRAGNPPPRLAETPCGLINSIGLQNVGFERFMEEELERWDVGLPIIVSVQPPGGGGNAYEGYWIQKMYETLAQHPLVSGIEVNMSCPNVFDKPLRSGWFDDYGHVMAHIRSVFNSDKLVTLKLSAFDAVNRAREVVRFTNVALTLINTIPALSWVEGYAAPLRGGLSGPAIKPIALRAVYEVSRQVDVPVIGCGGIRTEEDIEEFMRAGAAAVQIGSSRWVGDPEKGEE